MYVLTVSAVLSGCVQDSQQWLGRLIPDKQSLNEQLKQVQQNSLHREYRRHSALTHMQTLSFVLVVEQLKFRCFSLVSVSRGDFLVSVAFLSFSHKRLMEVCSL